MEFVLQGKLQLNCEMPISWPKISTCDSLAWGRKHENTKGAFTQAKLTLINNTEISIKKKKV